MAMERSVFIEILKDSYSAYYAVTDAEGEELPLSFRGVYFSREERYAFVKKANIWSNERNEFAYIFSAPSFDPALARRCIDFSLGEMLPKVKPHKEHQYTNCKVILIADHIDDDVAALVKKSKFSKSYGPLSVHGYTELLAAAVDLGREKAFANSVGRDQEKFFGKLFALRREETQSK